MAANMISHMPAFSTALRKFTADRVRSEDFFGCAHPGPFLTRAGIDPFVLQHNSIARSGLSTMLFGPTQAIPIRA